MLSHSVVFDSCDLMDCNPSGSSVHGILQARVLEWVVIPFSRESSQARDRTRVSCISGSLLTTEPPGKPIYSLSVLCKLTVLRFPRGDFGRKGKAREAKPPHFNDFYCLCFHIWVPNNISKTNTIM